MGKYPRKSWQSLVTPEISHLISDQALDLLSKMLQYDHRLRPTCQEAISHPYFEAVRREEAAQESKSSAGSVRSVSTSGDLDSSSCSDHNTSKQQSDTTIGSSLVSHQDREARGSISGGKEPMEV